MNHIYTINGLPREIVPLTAEDYQAIKARVIEEFPGVWLHHYGPAVEAEVLKRQGLAFSIQTKDAS